MMPSGTESKGNFAFGFCASKLRDGTDTDSLSSYLFAVCLTLSRGEGCVVCCVSWIAHIAKHLLCAAAETTAFSNKQEKMKLE